MNNPVHEVPVPHTAGTTDFLNLYEDSEAMDPTSPVRYELTD